MSVRTGGPTARMGRDLTQSRSDPEKIEKTGKNRLDGEEPEPR
jgi:hypothetical protein